MWLIALIACTVPPVDDTEADTEPPVDTEWTPPSVDERSYVRVMNHVWDRYGPDTGRGLDLAIPPENPLALVEVFPTGGNTAYADLLLPGTYDLAATDIDGAVVQLVEGIVVAPGVVATIELYGLASVPVTLGHTIVFDDRAMPDDGEVHLRLFNGATGTGVLDVTEGSDAIATGLVYGYASDLVALQLGSLTFEVDVATPVPPQPLDGVADARCNGRLDEDDFIDGRSRVVHGTFAPASGPLPGVGALLLYVDGDYPDDPAAQEPIALPCVAIP